MAETIPQSSSSWSRTWFFLTFLFIDAILTICLTTPIIPGLQDSESVSWDGSVPYKPYSSLIDLTILSAFRIVTALLALLISYCEKEAPSESPFELYHSSGEKKSREELEEEAVEENFWPWFIRYLSRHSFLCEIVSFLTMLLLIVKFLARLNVEIGAFDDKVKHHPVWWAALSVISILTLVEANYLESVANATGECARFHRGRRQRLSIASEINSRLTIPLMQQEQQGINDDLEENIAANKETSEENEEDVAGLSDISGDAQYQASFMDLAKLCLPDAPLFLVAFIFLIAAAVAQIYIPQFTGDILDALAESEESYNASDVWEVPGFMSNVIKLVIASLLAGILAGVRGSIFTLVGGRATVRMRMMVMDSLLSQDIGFFDKTKSGNLTSRLTSDTSIVGEQVTLYVNVLLRSTVQAIGVLIYMFFLSWQLTAIAFISVPCLTFVATRIGQYLRLLKKVMQKKFADGNAVSQAAFESMTTVRAFGAEKSELDEYETFMNQYLELNARQTRSYWLSNFCVYSLPQLVTVIVIYFGGLLVLSDGKDSITSGQLVTFMLYLSSLNDAFTSIGNISTSMAQTVGAADKVFELIHRQSQIKKPSTSTHPPSSVDYSTSQRVTDHVCSGLHPTECYGTVTLENVDMFYPARPLRKVLNNMTLTAPPGAVVALVGPSGGGKSSVVSLIQHLYEPSAGKVCIDGIEVHQLSPEWLSRHVSIVSQEPKLFGRSIRRNIIFGLEGTEYEPSLEEIKKAAELANASSFIENMPDGYETDVGERGVQLSGGQKQRIAIARALVRKPRILLLDEATSALDAESEASVQAAIDDMLKRSRAGKGENSSSSSMTVVVVAHRLSTIRSADVICVIEGGRIVEQGSHEDLVNSKKGTYSKLIERQLSSSLK